MKAIFRSLTALAVALALSNFAMAQGVDKRYAYYHGSPSYQMYLHYGYAMLPDGTKFVPTAGTPMYFGPGLASPYYYAGNYRSPYYRAGSIRMWYPSVDADGQVRWRR